MGIRTLFFTVVAASLYACGDDSTTNDTGLSDSGTGEDAAAEDAAVALPVAKGTDPTMLPDAPADCPELKTGMVVMGGLDVHLWVGERSDEKKGPILIFFHGTGGNGANAPAMIAPEAMTEIMDQGGIVISPTGSTMTGENTANNVWYTGDFDVVDDAVGCALKQLNIDSQRIYATGASAGGLQAGVMAFQRSGYLAASVPNSGGIVFANQAVLQDPDHVPAVMTLHGMLGVDKVYIEFATVSATLGGLLLDEGGFVINCDHGGGHVASPPDLDLAAWQFMKDHPFGVKVEPYKDGLPDTFPSYCEIIK